ncbi:MAG: hypothetical protein AB1746_12130 [Candidatus Zixiibacteriota bacterium]
MHFTYQYPEGDLQQGDLQQGDLLKFTDTIKEVLNTCHPYYASRSDYTFLIVLTQTCDLVRRRQANIKSRYITVAVVRPLEVAINRELGKYLRSGVEKKYNVCSNDNREWVEGFLKNLLNNNVPEYFYLEREPDLKIYEQYVAFLNLSIALKIEHYDKCLSARFGQLKEIFQAKLGWLLGNTYSRVGTPDWLSIYGQERFNEKIKMTLDKMCTWCDERAISFLAKFERNKIREIGNDYSLSQGELIEKLNEYIEQSKSRRHQATDIIIKHISQVLPELEEKTIEKLKTRLISTTDLSPFLR